MLQVIPGPPKLAEHNVLIFWRNQGFGKLFTSILGSGKELGFRFKVQGSRVRC